MAVVLSSKMSVNFHWISLLHTPKDVSLFSQLHEHLILWIDINFFMGPCTVTEETELHYVFSVYLLVKADVFCLD
jgi:hypothetical protein